AHSFGRIRYHISDDRVSRLGSGGSGVSMDKRRQTFALRLATLVGVLSVLTTTVALYLGLVWAPTDAFQGHAQRIFYIHVPMAWIAFLAFRVVFVAGIAYLARGNQKWDRIARSSAEIGLIFTTVLLISASFWGR